jgi:hypothetical protein
MTLHFAAYLVLWRDLRFGTQRGGPGAFVIPVAIADLAGRFAGEAERTCLFTVVI